jgi:hypothetical protein
VLERVEEGPLQKTMQGVKSTQTQPKPNSNYPLNNMFLIPPSGPIRIKRKSFSMK